jgi:hypothetical protein
LNINKEENKMVERMRDRDAFDVCLADILVAESLKKRENLQEEASSRDPERDVPNRAGEAVRSGGRTDGIARAIAKVHPCSGCGIRRRAETQPSSVFGRLHRWHRSWWPGWKIHQAALSKGRSEKPAAIRSIGEES